MSIELIKPNSIPEFVNLMTAQEELLKLWSNPENTPEFIARVESYYCAMKAHDVAEGGYYCGGYLADWTRNQFEDDFEMEDEY